MTYKEYLAALRSPDAIKAMKGKATREAKRVKKDRRYAQKVKVFTPEEIRAYCEERNTPAPT